MTNYKPYYAATVAILLTFSIISIGNLKSSFAQSSPVGECGPMDVAIAVDITGSMGDAIDNVKAELPGIIAQAVAASGGDLKAGLLSFDDDVQVINELTTDTASVLASITALDLSNADNPGRPEASNLAKDTAVNNLGSFSEPWRDDATKILILITDAPPGGSDSVKDPEDVAQMHDVAVQAKAKSILVSDVFIPTNGDYDGQAAILEDDAVTSGGSYVETAADGSGTGSAIGDILAACGSIDPDPIPPNPIPIPIPTPDAVKVTICHNPDDNLETSETITVPVTTLPSHLAHGDSLGACPEPEPPGPEPEPSPSIPEGIIDSGNNLNLQVQSNSGNNALGQDGGSSSNQYADEAISQGQSTEQGSSVVS